MHLCTCLFCNIHKNVTVHFLFWGLHKIVSFVSSQQLAASPSPDKSESENSQCYVLYRVVTEHQPEKNTSLHSHRHATWIFLLTLSAHSDIHCPLPSLASRLSQWMRKFASMSENAVLVLEKPVPYWSWVRQKTRRAARRSWQISNKIKAKAKRAAVVKGHLT